MSALTLPSSAVQSMTSREIADLTAKRHDHVLRDIDNLLKTLPPELGTGISEAYEGDPAHRYRYFILDRDSTYCLVAGYDAVARMRIIKRWQELESQVVVKTPGELLVEHANTFLRHEREIARLAVEQAETKAQVRALVDGEDYFTVVGYANLIGKKVDKPTAALLGKRVTRICKDKGWHIGAAPHPVHGTCGTYPREALQQAFSD